MTIGTWLLISGLLWISGFSQLYLLDPGPNSKLVFVPKWMFYLFGAPKNKDVPVMVMYARSVYLQLLGIIMALYGLLFDRRLVSDPFMSVLFGFFISMFISGLAATYLYRKHPYIWQNRIPWDE